MSVDAEEDVKPKLNITVNYEGQHVTVKVKANTTFRRIFDAAEQRFGKEAGTFKFNYEGVRINAQQTPAELGMEDGDMIDANLEQLGGCTEVA